MSTYIAYRYGKLNQSFIMKNENKETVYEANLVKFKWFTACPYEFNNKVTLKSEVRKVGKTVSTSTGNSNLEFTTKSYFKLDGVNVFKILEEKGYRIDIVAKLDMFHPEFALVRIDKNEKIATYKMNVKGEKQEGVFSIGNAQRNTVITTDSTDIELVFLGAFILSRVDFSLYLA